MTEETFVNTNGHLTTPPLFYLRRGGLWLIIVVMACGIHLEAQTVTKVGTTAAKFLSIPSSARSLGMGGAFVAVANDASAMYWNPSGLSRLGQFEAQFNHADWIADIDFNHGAVVLPFGEFGTLGLQFTSLTMDQMERTTEDNPEGTGEFFSAGSFSVGVSYARSLTEWFSIGGTVKFVNEYIWNSTASAFAIDLGTLFSTPFPGIKFGAGIANYGEKLQIRGDDLLVQKDISQSHGNNANVNAFLSTDRFDLPLVLRIGISYEPILSEDQELRFAVDAAHPNDNSESINLGAEYSVFEKILTLRAGYKNLGLTESEEQFTLGGGLKYTFEGNVTFKLDYAFQQFGLLKSVHFYTVSMLW